MWLATAQNFAEFAQNHEMCKTKLEKSRISYHIYIFLFFAYLYSSYVTVWVSFAHFILRKITKSDVLHAQENRFLKVRPLYQHTAGMSLKVPIKL